jgi:acyl carrier protein
MDTIKDIVCNFVIDNFLFGDGAGLEEDTSFLEEGIIDSTGVLELVAFLEETYSISIHDEELIPENLDSIKNIVGFIGKKKLQQAAA